MPHGPAEIGGGGDSADACRLTYTSDFFPQMVEMARALIGAGHIYADNTDVDRMREERMEGTPSQCRGQAAADTLRIFNEEMMPGTDVRPPSPACVHAL